ncbi:glycosyltransferase family 87 protein [Thermoflexus sp.]|uniref:glycosyltransferase family 87 protein n=1 Tax=Thermoflexus sp. TaxID=1969742 RepID=UPI002ADDE0AA|nr:glycosyltransferase family 87 protein [Thermoflexus sp.]
MKRIELLGLFLVALLYVAATVWILTGHAPIDYPAYAMAAWGFHRGEAVYRWEEDDYARAAAALGFSHYAPPYRYPPFTALWTLPLLGLPDRGVGIWIALQAACALLTAETLARSFGDSKPTTRLLVRLGVGFFTPFLTSLYAGQVNPMVTLLIALAIRLIGQGQEGRGGVLLGLSLMLKPLALGIVGLLLWEGRWKALAGLLLGITLALGMSVLAFGAPAMGFLHASLPITGSAYPPAQNLPSLAIRWGTHHPYGFALADAPTMARWAGLALSGLLILLTLIGWGRPGAPRPLFEVRAAWALTATFLANPGTWYHHGTVLSVGLAVLLHRASRHSRIWWAALATSAGAIALWGWAWHAFVGWTPLLDLATLGALGLWILLARERGNERAT